MTPKIAFQAKNEKGISTFIHFTAYQLCQPYVSFHIAFSIKQFFPLENFPHWHNAKMKDSPLTMNPR